MGNVGAAAMDIRSVPLNDLVLDPNLNLRDRLDDFTVERYADSWDRLPPIVVYDVDGKWLVADGFHRHAAAVMLGKGTIAAEVRVGNFTEALDFVSTVNLFHGLPLTRAERRRAVEIKLKLHHDWSDRRTAEELAVSRELVAKIRRQLIEGNQIPNNPGRVGSDGKLYTSAGLPKDPHERLPKGKAVVEDDEGTERGRRGMGATAAPPWEDAPPREKARSGRIEEGGRETGPPSRGAHELGPIDVSAPSIDELLELMSRQIMQVITWTQADGFVDSYRSAGPNARGLFHAAVIKLAARADQLRRS
jgi:ParB-like chromosome segregation protein Spo0J